MTVVIDFVRLCDIVAGVSTVCNIISTLWPKFNNTLHSSGQGQGGHGLCA